ncbi:MAG: hypothetical protein ACRC2T_09695 [Thermoguttaceae bacterium]
MFDKFLDWIDDHLSPITVLCFRRLAKKYTFTLVCFQAVAIIAILIGVLLSVEHFHNDGFPTILLSFIGLKFLVYCTIYLVFGGISGQVLFTQLEKNDPCISKTYLSRKETAWGIIQFSTINSLAMASILTGPISFLFIMNLVAMHWVYLYPFLCFLMAVVFALICAAYASAKKADVSQNILLFLGAMLPFFVLIGVAVHPIISSTFSSVEQIEKTYEIFTSFTTSTFPWFVLAAMLILVYTNAVLTINFNLGGKKRTFMQRWGAAYLSLLINVAVCFGAWTILTM